MNAVVVVERSMAAEDRMTRLESDVVELKGDVKAINARVGELIVVSAREFGNLRAQMERGFGSVRTEIERNRADMEKGFGALRASIESAKLWINAESMIMQIR